MFSLTYDAKKTQESQQEQILMKNQLLCVCVCMCVCVCVSVCVCVCVCVCQNSKKGQGILI